MHNANIIDHSQQQTKRLRVTLTPLEPYFFGTDRTFTYKEKNGRRSASYFMRSADTPSQTTLFGALRFLGIENPEKGFRLDKSLDVPRIGVQSFNLTDKPGSGTKPFGMIHKISPLYLADSDGKLHVKTPFDHRVRLPNPGEQPPSEEPYVAFNKYVQEEIKTDGGSRTPPVDYNAKAGLADSWLRLDDKMICNAIFSSEERTGIDKNKRDEAFFKKEYKFTQNHSFVFFADVDEEFRLYSSTVFLGHGKSAFAVKWEIEKKPHDADGGTNATFSFLEPDIVYAQSDIYLAEQPMKELYATCNFVATKTKTMRTFTTNYAQSDHRKRYTVSPELIRLIAAGSIFKVKNRDAFWRIIKGDQDQYKHTKIAGFNQLIERTQGQ
jgi:hypothetical protein